jgi:hypothetical protein
MRKLIIALTAIAALAAPALAQAASQPRQTTPVAPPPVTTPKNIGSQSSGAGAGKVTFNPFSITRKIDKPSPVFFAQ